MFDFDTTGLDSLELGSRRRPVKWAVELSLADCRPQKHKARRRLAAQEAAEQAEKQQHQQQHAQMQQQAQQQRVAAHRKHLEQLALEHQQDPAGVTPAQAKYRKEFRDSSVVCLSTEIEQGNVEYKYRLTGCITNENRRHQLTTQMKFRLSEGSGECFYYLGVEDDGYPRGLEPHELQDSIAIIHRMAVTLQATARLVEYVPGGFGRTAALMHIKANAEEDMRVTDTRVAVAGSMDSGKSTMVAVLTNGADGRPLLDNGRGSARMAVFRHKHEIESGRTSSISQQVLGYDDEGRVLNYVGVSTPTPADITAAATHMLYFIDMGGHEKYLKTTLYGMTCLLPDYALLCVDAVTGITRITREHLAVAVALEVPTALVVTKADAVDDQQLQHVLEQLRQLMQPVLSSCQLPRHQERAGLEHQPDLSNSSSTTACSVDTSSNTNSHGPSASMASAGSAGHLSGGVPVVGCEEQAVALAASLSELHSCTAGPAAPSFQQAVFPLFVVSCVTGSGIPLLHAFLSHLKPLQQHTQEGGSNTAGSSSTEQRGRLPAAATSSRGADASSSQVTSKPTQQQRQRSSVSPGVKPSTKDGSSQLWGVSSPSQRQRQEHQQVPASAQDAVVAAGAGEGLQPASDAAQQAAGGEVEDLSTCRPGHFQVVHTYDVEGVGWVVSGIAVTGSIEVGQSLLWGPTPEGGFSPVRVTCIQRSHVPVRQVAPGQTATLALQPPAAGLHHSGSKQALLTAAAVAQAAAAEAAAREAAAAIAAVPEPVAKTRRRSPAALKAAAAAAAHTAAAAAAAADAARRAAETACGKPWWQDTQAGGSTAEAPAADPAAACAPAAKAAAACGPSQQPSPSVRDMGHAAVQRFDAEASGAALGDSVADLLDDDFAADLAADDSDSGSSADLFGGVEEPSRPYGRDTSQNMGAATRDAGSATAAGAGAGDDVFAGLADVFDDADGDENQSPSRESSSSSTSSSGDSGGLSGSWSFSSSNSGFRHQDKARPSTAREIPARPGPAARAIAGAVRAQAMPSIGGSAGEHQLLGCSPSRMRNKGGVLLDVGVGAAPHTYWEFEALLVLLGGHWPPRGLLSGCWPPAGNGPAAEPAAASLVTQPEAAGPGSYRQPSAATATGAGVQPFPAHDGAAVAGEPTGQGHDWEQQSQRRLAQQRSRQQRRASKRYEFAYVIHCNSIRQIASVVCMQELNDGPAADGAADSDTDRDDPPAGIRSSVGADDVAGAAAGAGLHGVSGSQLVEQHCGLTVSIRAAAALLQGASGAASSDREASSGCASGDSSGDTSRRHQLLGSSMPACSSAALSVSRRGRRAPDAGSVVSVRFRFTHRPEWLQVGARLIARDRSDGHVAAAGFVTKLLQPHTQHQQPKSRLA